MGIPFYYHHLSKKYDNIISYNLPQRAIDLFCLDYNGIIHPVCQSTIHSGESTMLEALWKHTTHLIEKIRASKTLVSIDGVAPLAKIMQQRKRRYLSNITKKCDGWDSNNITHGTPFMKRLSSFIEKRCQENSIMFDHENGEAEHKIMDLIHLPEYHDKTVVIHGLDADLILLSLMSRCKHIYLLREQENSSRFLDVENLRRVIVQEWKSIFPNTSDDRDIIKAYCVCCSLIGNDFIPHPVTLNVKNHAMTHIKNAAINSGNLVENDKINLQSLTHILINLSKTEDNDVQNIINNKHNLTQDEEHIKKNLSRWRKYYYNNIMFINSVNDSCQEFLHGIHWTFNYYNKDNKHIDHGWFYPFNGAPSLRDLANYVLTYSYVPKNTLDDFIESDLKLLIVIPKASIDILPEHLKRFFENHEYGITFMYPSSFKLIKFLKDHDWEHVPCLPMIDIDLMEETLKKC